MAGTLFQSDASGWNLSKLDNMIKLLPDNLPGITTAMLYFGACCGCCRLCLASWIDSSSLLLVVLT